MVDSSNRPRDTAPTAPAPSDGAGSPKPQEPEAAKDPEVGTRYSAEEIHEHILTDADEEMERPAFELAYSGFAAGLSIGFSMLAAALLTSRMSPANAPLAKAITYPLGFIFVVLSRHQLFTENTLEPVIPLLERHTMEALGRVLRLWSIVLPANLLGAALFSFVVARTNALEPNLDQPIRELARHATEGGALLVFYRGIWAGWLVALMAWLLASTRETLAQIALIWLTTAPIAAFGFRHSIAGAVEAFYRVWIGDLGFSHMVVSYELPALAGNIVGGVVLVALVNHGQVGSKKKKG
jgi:formate/nitrite transporter FocA (FNT family)